MDTNQDFFVQKKIIIKTLFWTVFHLAQTRSRNPKSAQRRQYRAPYRIARNPYWRLLAAPVRGKARRCTGSCNLRAWAWERSASRCRPWDEPHSKESVNLGWCQKVLDNRREKKTTTKVDALPRTVLPFCISRRNQWATHPFPSSRTKCPKLANLQLQRPSPTSAIVQARWLPPERSRMRRWQGNQSNPSQESPSTCGNCLCRPFLPACSKVC